MRKTRREKEERHMNGRGKEKTKLQKAEKEAGSKNCNESIVLFYAVLRRPKLKEGEEEDK